MLFRYDGVTAARIQADFIIEEWLDFEREFDIWYLNQLRRRGGSIQSGWSHSQDDPQRGYNEKRPNVDLWRRVVLNHVQVAFEDWESELREVLNRHAPDDAANTNDGLNATIVPVLELLDRIGDSSK